MDSYEGLFPGAAVCCLISQTKIKVYEKWWFSAIFMKNFVMHLESQFISDYKNITFPLSPFCMVLAEYLWEGA